MQCNPLLMSLIHRNPRNYQYSKPLSSTVFRYCVEKAYCRGFIIRRKKVIRTFFLLVRSRLNKGLSNYNKQEQVLYYTEYTK